MQLNKEGVYSVVRYSVHYRKPFVVGAELLILQARGFANRTLDSSEQSQIRDGLTRLL